MSTVNVDGGLLPCERALGVIWNVENDKLGFKISIVDKPCTKRNILSVIFSIYDPCFLISPANVNAKKLLKEVCSLNCTWDDTLPEHLELQWNTWKANILLINSLEIPRPFFANVDNYENVQLHIFCDGSLTAYGAVAYLLRCHSNCCSISACSIVLARVRLTPLRRASLRTVPRIELNTAKIGVELYLKVICEINYDVASVWFWSDSSIVLNYIASNNGRFQRFVANRVAFIRTHTSVSQWIFVPGELNPADLLSRGTSDMRKFIDCSLWFGGRDFLLCDEKRNN